MPWSTSHVVHESEPVWIVRTSVNIQPTGHYSSIGGCLIIVTRRRGDVFESLVRAKEHRAQLLVRRPEVMSVERAPDGAFSDKSFGTVIISNGGKDYVIEGPNPETRQQAEGWREGMTMPRWKRRNWHAKHNHSERD